MPPLQKLTGVVGLNRQSAGKGTPVASPASYGLGVMDGHVFEAPITQDYDEVTMGGGVGDRVAPRVIRTEIMPGATFKTRATPRVLPLLMWGALGANVTTGAGPFTHTGTTAMDLPYFTLFGRLDSAYERLQDCKINELQLSWSEREAWELDCTFMGTVPLIGAGGAFTVTNDETSQDVYTPSEGVFQIDVDGASLAVTNLTAFSLRIANNLEPIPLSKSVLPDDVFPRQQVIEGTITTVPDNLDDWRTILTGSAAGTAVEDDPIYGSFSIQGVIDANTDATFTASRVAFLAEFPESDPAGGGAEVELAFSCVRPTAGGTPFTSAIRNAVASY